MEHHYKKLGFTLAEVLITLGLIGIVAALTIPAIVTNYQKKVTAKRLGQTYSILSQALSAAQAEYGDMSQWGMGDMYGTEIDQDNKDQQREALIRKFADNHIIPYIKITNIPKLEKLSDAGYKSGYKTKDGRTYLAPSAKEYIVDLANGASLFLGLNGNASIYTYPIIFVDINGATGPNMLGRDFFMFELTTNQTTKVVKLTAAGYGYSRETLKSNCRKDVSVAVPTNLRCTALIMLDGWEIKDDYPW